MSAPSTVSCTLVAKYKVGLISVSRLERERVTLGRTCFSHSWGAAPVPAARSPAQKFGGSRSSHSRGGRRGGPASRSPWVPGRGSACGARLRSPRPGRAPRPEPLTDRRRQGRPAAPGKTGPAVTCRAGRRPARARWRCSRPRVCGWLRRPPHCAPGTEGSGPPCSRQPQQLRSTPRRPPRRGHSLPARAKAPRAAHRPRLSPADSVTEQRRRARGRGHRRFPPPAGVV